MLHACTIFLKMHKQIRKYKHSSGGTNYPLIMFSVLYINLSTIIINLDTINRLTCRDLQTLTFKKQSSILSWNNMLSLEPYFKALL